MTTVLDPELDIVTPRVGSMSRGLSVLSNIAIVALAIVIGLANVGGSGSLVWDAPRYANGGAMIYDWLRSGEWLHPYQFAKLNYCQYPGFSIPYHPPLYPALLAAFFAATGGVSYLGARVFIALCTGVGACLFA